MNKRRRGRKLLSFLLTLALMLGLLPGLGGTALAANSGTCGDNLSWTLENSTLTISGSGAMADYENIRAEPWFNDRNDINAVVIGNGVTSIGNGAFNSCTKLASVTISNTVTSIGSDAFKTCSELTSVEIPNSVTSIGGSAFADCGNLTSIEIPNGVTNIGDLTFQGCYKLSTVTFACATANQTLTVGTNAFEDVRATAAYSASTTALYDGDTAIEAGASLTSLAGKTLTWKALPSHAHNDITFTAWSSADSLPTTAGSYYLTQDVTIGSTWNVPTGETNLCLNGHGIRYSGSDKASVITVGDGVTLNLYDCGTTEHKYTVDSSGLATVNDSATDDGVKTFTGGYITGGNGTENGGYYSGGGIYVSGTLTMSGGTIIGNTAAFGGGVRVWTNGTFTMSGGSITGNMARSEGGSGPCAGGGVQVEWDGAFTMSGGSITGNTAYGNGGGVYASAGMASEHKPAALSVSGAAVIKDNVKSATTPMASNIYLYLTTDYYGGEEYSPKIAVGALTSDASIGVTMASPGVFTSGDIAKNYIANFTSDNSAYSVVADGNELKLAQPAVSYQAASWDSANNQVTYTTESCTDYTVVTDSTTAWEDGKWYVVKDNVTISSRITVSGTANLILCDGATLTASKGITVGSGQTLNIYAQSEGTGALIAQTESTVANNAYGGGAGIGGIYLIGADDAGSGNTGIINIHGGIITARGGYCSAGIGGGYSQVYTGGPV